MLSNQRVDQALKEMEREEHEDLSWYLLLALMEEPYEKADAFRARLQRCRTLGQVRDMVERKVNEHFGERGDPRPCRSSQDFVADW